MDKYFQGLKDEKTRTATRAIPTSSSSPTPTAKQPSAQSGSSGPNIGAIVGGTVGGVVALVIIITIVLFYLRRKRCKQATPNLPELPVGTKPELGGQTMAQKPTGHYSISEGGTTLYSTCPSLGYSPPPASNSWNNEIHYFQGSPPLAAEEWAQQGGYSHAQQYYPPPPGPSLDPRVISAELPDVRSPANAELSDIRSPIVGEMSEMRYPSPVRVSR